jgi:hypothetical protein
MTHLSVTELLHASDAGRSEVERMAAHLGVCPPAARSPPVEDDRLDYGEQRFVTFGVMEGRVVAAVHTEQSDTIRIISIRKATKREEQSYFSTISE